jgi:hypothetical protein
MGLILHTNRRKEAINGIFGQRGGWPDLGFGEMSLRGDVVAGFVILFRRIRRSAELL